MAGLGVLGAESLVTVADCILGLAGGAGGTGGLAGGTGGLAGGWGGNPGNSGRSWRGEARLLPTGNSGGMLKGRFGGLKPWTFWRLSG